MCPTDSDRSNRNTKSLVNRRAMLATASAMVASPFVLTTTSQPASAADDPAKLWAQPGDRIQIVRGEFTGKMLKPAMLIVGDPQTEAFPIDPAAGTLRDGNRLNRLLVIRLDPAEMDAETLANQTDGVLIYSAVCTHRGCTIKSWMPEERNLRCHCHLSQFDALSGGSVMRGPARRRLPAVPVALDAEGYVVAAAGFTAPVGAERT